MNIADLFVSLGIKGADKTLSTMKDVKVSIADIGSTSLATKAALVGMMYGLERLMSNSMTTGNNLMQFATATGLSAESLQRWQYAARQAGVQGEELTSSVEAVQKSIVNMMLGKGNPEGMRMVANSVGIDPAKARDTFYMLGKLQEFAKKAPADVGNTILSSFGLTQGIINAMRRDMFRPEVMNKAPIYSNSGAKALQAIDVQWANLGQKIEMAIGKLNIKHGGKLVSDISMIVEKVTVLADRLVTLADRLKIFELIGESFKGWAMILDQINGGIGSAPDAVKKNPKGFLGAAGTGEAMRAWVDKSAALAKTNLLDFHAPISKSLARAPVNNTANTNVVVNAHGVKDAADSAQHMQRAITGAFNQSSVRGQTK